MPPATDPASEQILDAIISTLAGINGGADYTHDFSGERQVVRYAQWPGNEVWDNMIQLAGLESQDDENQGHDVVEVTQEFAIGISLRVWNEEDKTLGLEEAIADVKKAVRRNEQLGGLAARISLGSTVRWEYRGESPQAGAAVRGFVQYKHAVDDPYVIVSPS